MALVETAVVDVVAEVDLKAQPAAIIQPLAEKAVAAVVSAARTNAPGVDPDRLRKLLSI
jgi:hypothetical protein